MIRTGTMRKTCAAGLVALALSGCSLFNGVDDTVLPGKREDAIPGQSSFPAPGDNSSVRTAGQPASTGDASPDVASSGPDCSDPKNKSDPACAPADSTASSDGTFSDGQ